MNAAPSAAMTAQKLALGQESPTGPPELNDFSNA